MSAKDIFDKPFDDGTISKLKIFEDYFKEWLPVFISKPQPIWKEIQIFDLFAGAGKDVKNIYGSPLRILSILNDNFLLIKKSGVKIHVVLNEFDKDKFLILKENIDLLKNDEIYTVECYNDDFIVVFNQYYSSMKNSANFLFLDQNGIKQITESVFAKLINLKQTDFLFFISSSFIKRFSDVEEFQKYLKITKQDLEGKTYYHIHRVVLNYYRSMIPEGRSYFLAPFSIKKPAGIYGLIFGTNHTLGMEKFLTVSWKHDKLTGEANFDIDSEKIDLNKPGLFAEYNIPSKRQLFENSLKEKILSKKLKTDKDVYLFTLNEGFLIKDANTVLKLLKAEKKINADLVLTNLNIHRINPISTLKIL